jgi:hypothetical protein
MALTLHGTVSDNTVALDRKTATPLIINGDMAIAQRGTSLSSQSSSTRLLDRFANDIGGGGAITISQDTDTPNSTFPNSMKMVVATADSSIAAADAYRFTYSVEGKDIATVGLGNSDCQTMTLTFWVRSSVTGTYGIGFQNSAETENYVDEYAISSANTWEKKVINIPVRTSGTWLTTNGVGLGIRWDLGSGTNYNGTADTWQTTSGKVYRTSSCVNWIATASATFYVTGVQLEIGTFDANSIADFQHEDVGTSLARCQRYFQKSFPQGTAPQNYSSYVAGQSDNSIGATMSSTEFKTVITLKCEMRSAPTITYYRAQNTPEDGEWTFFDGGDKLNPSSMASNSQTHRFTAVLTYSSGLTAGNSGLCQGNYKADAEL